MKITKKVVTSFAITLVIVLVSTLNIMVLADSVSVDIYSSGSGWYRGEADGAAIGVHVSPGSEGEVIVVFNRELVNADKGTCSGNEWHYDASSGETNIYTNVYGIDFTSGISCTRTEFIPVSSPIPVPKEDEEDDGSDEEAMPPHEEPSSDSDSEKETHIPDTPSSGNDGGDSSEAESSSDSSETGDSSNSDNSVSNEENKANNVNDNTDNGVNSEENIQEGITETNPLLEGATDNAQGNTKSTKGSQKSQITEQQTDVKDSIKKESGNYDTPKRKCRCLFWIILLLILLILLLLRILYLYIYRKLRGKELWISIIPFGKLKEQAVILWDKFIIFIGKSGETIADKMETNDVSSYEEFNDTNTAEGEVVNGYLQKSNIAPLRPIKSNVSEDEIKKKSEQNTINNKDRIQKQLQSKNEKEVDNKTKNNTKETKTDKEEIDVTPTENTDKPVNKANKKSVKPTKEVILKTVQPSTGNVKYSNTDEVKSVNMKEVNLDEQGSVGGDGNIGSPKGQCSGQSETLKVDNKANSKGNTSNNSKQGKKGKGKRKKGKGNAVANVNASKNRSNTSSKAQTTAQGKTAETSPKDGGEATTFADMLDRMHDL